jgi:amino acid adenylation domain-containing protein
VDGNLEYLGRLDQQVKIRGFRIELEEIEAILETHPSVACCVVIAREDQPGEKRLVAYYTWRESIGEAEAVNAGAEQLRLHLSAILPDYMVPAAYMRMESLPLTSNGKLDRKALPVIESMSKSHDQAKLPLGETERIIADIWKQVLKIEEVGVDDKFFHVGGHSLLLPKVQKALQDVFGVDLTIVELFQYPTIRSLAEHLDATPAAEPVRPDETVKAEQPRSGTKEFAIVGMVCRFPGAGNIEEFWHNLQAGVESIIDFSDEELRAAGVGEELLASPHYIKRGSMVANVDLFDARFFDISAREAELIDPQQRIFLECAWEALENAGYTPKSYPGKIGLYAGSGPNTYFLNLLTGENSLYSKDAAPVLFANGNDFLATRVSYKLDLTGPSVTVQTACSTSLVAVDIACRALLNHQCDIAMAGGITIRTPQNIGDIFQEGGIVSPDGHNRTFDERAQGTVRGNGAGIVVIKRLEDALADGDHIRAVIKGSAINNDGGNKVGFTAPSVTGQRDVIRQALLDSGVSSETITYLEAHGTATSLGDPIEVSALSQAYRAGTEKNAYCAIGSVKSNIGHADAAAGIAGLIKTVLALEHKLIPPTLHFERPNPKIDFLHSPFYVNTRLAEWERENGPRRAGVSSFGIGGTNAHVILEEAPSDDSIGACRPWQLLLLSAKTATALETAADNLGAYLLANDSVSLPDVAHTFQVGRASFSHRSFVVAENNADAAAALKEWQVRSSAASVVSRAGWPVAFLFPGQGSQYVNMGKQLYAHEPLFRELVDECSELLQPNLQLDLRSVLYPTSEKHGWAEAELRETRTTQPALFVVEYALARMWMSWGLLPERMLGHSVGEYVAACLAGVFSLEDALNLVTVRGRLMQSCARGGMLAIAASEKEVQRCLKMGLDLAAINGSASCVLSGPFDALELAEKELARQQVVHRRLQSSHAFHSAMMDPIIDQFVGEVEKVRLNAPRMRYLSNLTGEWITEEQVTDPEYWGKQLRGTVQFAKGIRNLCDGSDRLTLEVGPGHTNITAIRQTLPKPALPLMLTTLDSQTEEPDVKHVLTVLGHLWLHGANVDWNAFASGEKRRRLPLPTYPFERQRFWVEAAGSRPSHPDTSRKKLDDWLYLPRWKETARISSGSKADVSESATVLMFGGNSRFEEKLALKLGRKRYDVVTVVAGEEYTKVDHQTYAIRPTARADYDALFAVLGEQGQLPEKILHLWNIGHSDSVEQDVDIALYSPLHLVQAATAVQGMGPIQCVVVSSGLHEITGHEDLSPGKATLLGLCKTIACELPHFACKSVDIEVPAENSRTEDSLVDQLVAELESKEQQPVVSYRGVRRWIQTFDQVHLEADGTELVREGGVYLITGGLNDIGFQFAEWLATEARASIVLLDQRSFPRPEHWDIWPETHTGDPAVKQISRIRAWEQGGAKVLISSADVANQVQMNELRDQVQRVWGKVNGVIHAAGSSKRGPLALKTRNDVATILLPKIQGALVLEEVFGGGDLDFMVFCSSLISVIGEREQADYAAANAFLDSLARRNFLVSPYFTMSINWDTWGEADRDGSSVASGAACGAIRPDEAVEVLRRLLRAKPDPQAIISTRDLALVARLKRVDTAEEKAGTAWRIYARPNLDRPVELPTNATEALLLPIWTEVLGVSPIGIDDDFFDLGGDSLIGLRMTARLEDLGVHVSIEQLFRHRTVQKLAAAVDQVELAEKIPAIIRVPRDQPIPLSYTQQRVWFIDRLTPGGSAYSIPASVRIQGSLNLVVLERVLQEIVSRHESLRTRIEVVDGEPRQVIQDRISMPLPVIDLGSSPEEEQETAARRLARSEIQKPFDLQTGPLVRGCLLKLAEQDHVLVVTMHHVVSDGWSLGILVREVSALYKAFSAGERSPLAELHIQYADYSVWQREWVSGKMLEQQLDYWKRQLAEVSVLDLPTDFPRPLLQSQKGDTIEFNVSAELTVKLKQLSLQQGTTLYMTLLAAFQTLLSRYSRQQDIATGSPIAGRSRTETENLIGFFVNTLVLRTDLSGSLTFATLLQRVKKSTLEAYAHQDVPFEKLVEVLSPARDLGRSPLYQAMFALQNAPYSTLELGLATLQRFDVHTVAAQCDLTLIMAEMSGGMMCSVEYSTDLFEAATIGRMIEQFKVLMEGIVADPEQSIAALPLLTPSERRQLVDEWNLTEANYPREKSLTDLFEEQAQRTPNAVAVSSEEGRLTYAELNAQANQIARYLRRLGVGPEAPVGMCMERSLEMVKGLLGILKAGGVYVPLDPAYPLERLLRIVADSRAPVTLVQERWVEELPPHSGRLVKVDAEWPQISQENQDNLCVELDMANLAYVIYTSGSTGGPKGAMNTHGGILNRLLWMQERFGLKEDDRVLQKTPICFDISLWEFLWPLMVGAELVMAKPGGHLDAEYMAKVIEEKKITTLHFVPSALRIFLESAGSAKCASVRRVVCSGEVLSLDLQSAFFDRFVSELHNFYGPTEAAVDATFWACEQNHGRQSVPIGKPIANAQIYVLDGLMEPTPPGVPGELYIGGTGLARGYLGQVDLTAQRFIANPFSATPGERLYQTGDLARYLPDGNLDFLGRIDDQVKIGGHRIEPGEVEEIVQNHPAVQQAAVVVEEEKSIKRLIAYVVPRAGQVVNAFDLKGHVRRSLPEAMVPSTIVEVKEFPLTASGKIDRKRLPKVEGTKSRAAESGVAPRTEIERYIAEVWREFLQIDKVSVEDNFFDLGGHSLMIVLICTRLASRFNERIKLVDLFSYPTIAALAKYLERSQDDTALELAALERADRQLQAFAAVTGGRREVD